MMDMLGFGLRGGSGVLILVLHGRLWRRLFSRHGLCL